MKTTNSPSTCNEAAVWFDHQSDESQFIADRRLYRELAKTMRAFGNIPVPTAIKQEWTWRGLSKLLEK